MGKNTSLYFMGIVIIVLDVSGILLSITSSGLYAWLIIPAFLLSLFVYNKEPKWFNKSALVLSILSFIYFLYGFVGSF